MEKKKQQQEKPHPETHKKTQENTRKPKKTPIQKHTRKKV